MGWTPAERNRTQEIHACQAPTPWGWVCRVVMAGTLFVIQIMIKWERSFFFLGGGGPLVSHHNLLEVPSWVIYANNTEPLDEHWTMRRTLEKSALWRWGELNSKLNAMGIFLPMFLHMLAVAQRVRKFACRPASNGALRTTAWIWAKHRNGPSWCNRKCQDNVYVRREHQSTM